MNRYMTDKFAGTILGVNTFRLRQFPDVQLGNVTGLERGGCGADAAGDLMTTREAVMRGVTIPVSAAWSRARVPRSQRARRQAKDVAVTAATETLYFEIRSLGLERGRAFTARRSRPACRSSCWPRAGREAVREPGSDRRGGEDLRPAYRVIGIVEKQGNLFGLSLDKFAVAPATAPH